MLVFAPGGLAIRGGDTASNHPHLTRINYLPQKTAARYAILRNATAILIRIIPGGRPPEECGRARLVSF